MITPGAVTCIPSRCTSYTNLVVVEPLLVLEVVVGAVFTFKTIERIQSAPSANVDNLNSLLDKVFNERQLLLYLLNIQVLGFFYKT